MINLLFIEDNLEFAELLSDFLSSRSIKSDIVDDPYKAMVMPLDSYDIVLLDLGLPGVDGLEVCKNIRKKSKIPIIISSARTTVNDKVIGLQIGADDYIAKPYDPDELYARVVSLLRRTKDEFEEDQPQRAFVIDKSAMDITYLGNPLLLTVAEFEVFSTLIKNYGSSVSKEQLLQSARTIQCHYGKSLEMIISKIRQKIKQYSQKKHILTLRNIGYRVVE
ncbi:MAG: hypothetical protein B1H07_02255 [Campylobacteraceae bacterium 4484_166]|nr:MAG: hypothetical protein B1H07_02255 [Campylobacteraceae bacterium 4484_166]